MKRHKTRHRGIYYRVDSKGNRRYIVWFPGSDGKGHTQTLPPDATEKDALRLQAHLRHRKASGERIAPSRVTLAELASSWLEEQKVRLRPKTIEIYAWGLDQHVLPALGRRKVSEITVDDIARFVNDLRRQGLAEASIRNCLTPLSRALSHAVRRGVLTANPVRGLEKHERPKGSQRVMRILSSDEIENLLVKVPTRYVVAITTAVFTGMRMGELLALRWSDVDFEAGTIEVREGKTNAAARSIVLMPALSKNIRLHKLGSPFSQNEDLVFPSETGRELGRRNLARRGLEKGLRDAGLDHCRFHDLRHTFASLLIGQGMDVTYVADQLGHTDPAVTLSRYAKLFDPTRRREEAREKLEVAFGGML